MFSKTNVKDFNKLQSSETSKVVPVKNGSRGNEREVTLEKYRIVSGSFLQLLVV